MVFSLMRNVSSNVGSFLAHAEIILHFWASEGLFGDKK
jgi:hypothetical protein